MKHALRYELPPSVGTEDPTALLSEQKRVQLQRALETTIGEVQDRSVSGIQIRFVEERLGGWDIFFPAAWLVEIDFEG